MEVAPQWHRNGTSCVEAYEAEHSYWLIAQTVCYVPVMTRKRSNTAMATATKIKLLRAAQVYRECAGKIVSAATAEWHELNAICQRPWMLKQQLRQHEQQLQRHESDDITLLSNAQCAILLLLRRENDRIHSHGSIRTSCYCSDSQGNNYIEAMSRKKLQTPRTRMKPQTLRTKRGETVDL